MVILYPMALCSAFLHLLDLLQGAHKLLNILFNRYGSCHRATRLSAWNSNPWSMSKSIVSLLQFLYLIHIVHFVRLLHFVYLICVLASSTSDGHSHLQDLGKTEAHLSLMKRPLFGRFFYTSCCITKLTGVVFSTYSLPQVIMLCCTRTCWPPTSLTIYTQLWST